jgi:DNA-binding IscR family transcriptional regulator
MGTNETVLATLKKSAKPMKSGEIATAAGIDKKEVDKAIKDLKKKGLITSPKNCYYTAGK